MIQLIQIDAKHPEMEKTMRLKMGIAIVFILLALSFPAEARVFAKTWVSACFGKLPKNVLVPPSAPSTRTNLPPHISPPLT